MALNAGFLIGGDTNETPQSLARKRALIAQILANGRAPTSVGEGLTALGDGIVANVLGRRADKAEAAGMASANDAFAPLLSGFGASAASSGVQKELSALSPDMASTAPSGSNFDSVAPRLISDLSRDFNLSPEQAAGVVGQLGHESAGFGTLQEVSPTVPGSRGGFGYAQWTGPRRKDFEAWTAQNGMDPTSYDANYGFLAHELKNTPEGRALEQVRSAPDALSAGRAFTDTFLRPGIPGYQSRDKWTERALAFADPAKSNDATAAISAAAPASGYVDPMISVQSPGPMHGPTQNGLPFDLVSKSPQLANADPKRGILRALLGITGREEGATGEFPARPSMAGQQNPQAAPAPAMGQPSPMPQMAPQGNFPPAPTPPSQTGPSIQQLVSVIQNPWLNDQQRAVAQTMLEQKMQEQDPMRQIQLEKSRLELEAMRNPEPGFRVLSNDEKQAYGLPTNGAFQIDAKGKIMEIGGGGVTINNEGNIPAGYQANRDAQGRIVSLEPIPGSPAALDAQKAQMTQDTKGDRKQTATDVITTAASEARHLIDKGFLTTGTPGRIAANLSESDAAELRRQISVLTSQATIETLSAMRQASPTGGALGNVTEKEGAMLAAAAGAIDPNAGRDQVKKQLDNYERTLLRVIHGPSVGDAIFEQTRQSETGDTPAPEGIDPQLWGVMTPEEKMLWQK